MATVKMVAEIMEKLFPPENVCMQDYIGLSVGSYDAEANEALVCLDCTEAVANEAKQKGIKLIISHHPLIFGSISEVTDQTPTGRVILTLIKNGINLFSAHTNMDCSRGGINEYVADVLGLKNTSVLIKNEQGDAGVGIIGDVDATTLVSLAQTVSNKLGDKYVKPYGKNQEIKRVAVINGSGGDIEYIREAKNQGATCFITSEIKHHVALYAVAEGVNLIETGHYASERIFISKLTERLNEQSSSQRLKMQFITSENESNPAL